MAQSCLEVVSIKARHTQMARSDYNREDQYTATHPDALATGDAQGKGTNAGGHHFWLPDCSTYNGTSVFRYDDFDTGVNSGAGNNVDNEMRTKCLARSMYNGEQQYSAVSVDSSANIREGQFVLN